MITFHESSYYSAPVNITHHSTDDFRGTIKREIAKTMER